MDSGYSSLGNSMYPTYSQVTLPPCFSCACLYFGKLLNARTLGLQKPLISPVVSNALMMKRRLKRRRFVNRNLFSIKMQSGITKHGRNSTHFGLHRI